MTDTPRIFDRSLRARRLARAAALGGGDFLRRRAAEDIAERLLVINRRFARAAEIGAVDESLPDALAAAGAADRIGALVRGGPAGTGVGAVIDEERLPFAAAGLDLIVSNLALHWVNDLVGALVQIRLALAPDGLFIGALLGGATLNELRASLLEAEAEIRGGAGPRVSPFVDSPDAGGLLQRAGFALPVVDTDQVKVRYAHPLKLLADLRAMGETSALIDRPRAPLSRPVLARACAIYQNRFADPDGRVRATFEIITLTGWAPHPGQQQPLERGSGQVGLAEALHQVRRGNR